VNLRKNIGVELGARLKRECCNIAACITKLKLEPGTERVQLLAQTTHQLAIGGIHHEACSGVSFNHLRHFLTMFLTPIHTEKEAFGTCVGTGKSNLRAYGNRILVRILGGENGNGGSQG